MAAPAQIISEFVSKAQDVLALDSWMQSIPSRLQWPMVHHRIEDGGGLLSASLCMKPVLYDRLAALRSCWFKRLSDSKDCLRIAWALASGCKDPPLTEHDLNPYLDDLLEIPGIHSAEIANVVTMAPLGTVPSRLWCRVPASATSWGSAGCQCDHLQPSPAWPTQDGTIALGEPLQKCLDS